jgi:signal transduction histidine kinase
MKDLVEQLLFLARGDNNTIKLQFLKFLTFPSLQKRLFMKTQLIDTTHNFDVHTADMCVTADRSLIKQALRITHDNAIKYTDCGGSITVVTQQKNEFAITVGF